MSSASQPISAARSAAAVSVVKNGLPVPAAKITTRPFSMCRSARRGMKGSHTVAIGIADCTRVSTPTRSSAFCMASAFITVASMPMLSACARSMPAAAPAMPRKMLPPPMTRQTCTPSATTPFTSVAMRRTVPLSSP